MGATGNTTGVSRYYYGTSTEQCFYQTVSDTSLAYSVTHLNNITISDFCCGLAQDPDIPCNNEAGNKWITTDEPFPAQCTTVMSKGDVDGNWTAHTIELPLQSVTLVMETVLPAFDDSAGQWKDVAAQSIGPGDYVITSTITQANSNGARSIPVTSNTNHGLVTGQRYFQPMLQSVDYYCVTGDDEDAYAVYVATDLGGDHI